MSKIIEGKQLAKKIRDNVRVGVETLKKESGVIPKLAVILAADTPASQIYVRNKEKACVEVGIATEIHRFPASIKERQVVDTIKQLNRDKSIHGIFVQLPLPKSLNAEKILEEVLPEKDVDGLHPLNLGKLLKGIEPLFIPCTPQGIMELILSTGVAIAGLEAVVVGRSNLVGKPTAILLLQHHATVTICHSHTQNLQEKTQRADILIVAVGHPNCLSGEMIKKGAIVIDVGINRVGEKLVGDVEFETAFPKAAFLTPVPGGVGPMTIAMLLKNTLLAAQRATSAII